ncbi:nitroreductase/quinone reductase family protein [Actinoplanes solisilvae]|uniref:nitroreductase/quinone reductase family protein n=1 Tax=Actinoplanes solisilvae TaxID=2486853 RepID=UPI000FDA7FEF|nr:nitroreductase/quinone reductase family protein [Actinoplanes solisilvae]
MASFNDTIIENFRANAGVLGGHWENKETLLLHTPGRKTGKVTINPLVAAPDGTSYVLCGSAGGADKEPAWLTNLEALEGPVTIELGTETLKADHKVVRPGDADWDRLYGLWRAYWPDAADYETKTDRKFPVAVITVA